MTYPARLYDILMYGWALLIILGILTLLSAIVVLYKWQRMIATGTHAIQSLASSMLMPLLSIVWLFRDGTKKTTKAKKDL